MTLYRLRELQCMELGENAIKNCKKVYFSSM